MTTLTATHPALGRTATRRRWPVWLLTLLAALLLVGGAAALALWSGGPLPVRVTVDGQEWLGAGVAADAAASAGRVTGAMALLFGAVVAVAVLTLVSLVPLAIGLVLALLAGLLVLVVGLPLLLVALTVGLVLSPLILLGWLLWWALS